MASTYTGADLFVDALDAYGVSYLFGNPGTTELPVMLALEDSPVEYRLALHEDSAVGMAAGYAQTRRYHAHRDDSVLPVGVANLHITPGVAHGLGNLYGASMTGAPLVVTAGNHGRDQRHEEPILTGDLVAMTDQFTKWSDEVLDVSALPSMLRRAFRVALTPPTGPVFLALPYDVLTTEIDHDPEPLGAIPTAGRGDRAQVEQAADLLVEADDVTMVVGDGVARAGQDAVQAAVDVAEATGARVHGEILACEVNFPASHDQWLSYIPPMEDLAQTLLGTDTLLLVGTSTNTTYTPHEDPLVDAEATTCIYVSDDAWQLGKNHRTDAAVLGDPGEVLSELADEVRTHLDASTLDSRLSDVAAMKEFVQMQMQQMGQDDAPDDPRASKAELVDAMRTVAEECADDVFVVDEGVTAKYAMLTRWPFEAEGIISNKGGGLGYGLPAAVGAAIAEDERDREAGEGRRVVGFVGDGSYLYSPQAIYSAVRYDVDLTVVVPDNRNYRILKDNALAMFGGEEADYEFIGTDFEPPVDLVANARSYGASAERVETPSGIESEFTDALDASGTHVLDVLVHD